MMSDRQALIPHLVCAGAADAGASVVMPSADMFGGDRYGMVQDPFGHRWPVAKPQRAPMSSAELAGAMSRMTPGCAS